MNIGRLNKRVELKKHVEIPDGMGGRKKEWVTQTTIWADFKTPKMTNGAETGTTISEMTWEIGIRFYSPIRKGWKVVYDSRIFDVLHTYDYGREKTVLICREVVK